jgi:DNA-directed RNA polymerase
MKQLGLGFLIDEEAQTPQIPAKRTRFNVRRLRASEGEGENGFTEEQQRILDAISPDGRFIDLCTILPPLPKKGSFDVKTIKESQYFFS